MYIKSDTYYILLHRKPRRVSIRDSSSTPDLPKTTLPPHPDLVTFSTTPPSSTKTVAPDPFIKRTTKDFFVVHSFLHPSFRDTPNLKDFKQIFEIFHWWNFFKKKVVRKWQGRIPFVQDSNEIVLLGSGWESHFDWGVGVVVPLLYRGELESMSSERKRYIDHKSLPGSWVRPGRSPLESLSRLVSPSDSERRDDSGLRLGRYYTLVTSDQKGQCLGKEDRISWNPT